MFLDMRTIFFSYVITDIVCTVFMVFLWVRNRQRFAGLFQWVIHYVMQVTSLLLILTRGILPDLLSVVVANSLIIGGVLALFMGLERFVEKAERQARNGAFLLVFVLTYMVACPPVLDAAGHLDKVIHVATDITDIRKAEERIRVSEETYRNIFQNAQVGLYRTRISDGKTLESNEQLARMFGLPWTAWPQR